MALCPRACTGCPATADECWYDVRGRLVCQASGTIPGTDTAVEPNVRTGERPPMRYLYTRTDPVIGDCYYWSTVPGGLDTWDPANDGTTLLTTTQLPRCPATTAPLTAAQVEARAWEVFRSFPLRRPELLLEPGETGITGLPTYLSAATPDPISHRELLPDGRRLDVRARVVTLDVNWGDGAESSQTPQRALPYPDGEVVHTYLLKTCSAEYRASNPSGPKCHPTLETYPITAAFAWQGEYRVGEPWVVLGTLTLATAVAYDVDEVMGVLQP